MVSSEMLPKVADVSLAARSVRVEQRTKDTLGRQITFMDIVLGRNLQGLEGQCKGRKPS